VRWIDDIIKTVVEHPYISPTHKQVLITRIEKEPTQEEINKAVRILEKNEVKHGTDSEAAISSN
jgi:hypothetical protein